MVKKIAALFVAVSLLPIWPVYALSSTDSGPVGKNAKLILDNGHEVVGIVREWNSDGIVLDTDVGEMRLDPKKVSRAVYLESPAVPPGAQEPSPQSSKEEEKKWRDKLNNAQAGQVALWALGIGGAVAGVALYSSGNSDENEAKSTPGCSYSGGDTIYCRDSRSQAAAQSKLDSAATKTLTGSVALLAGTGFMIWGVFQNGRVKDLKRAGKKKGFQLSYDAKEKNNLSLVYVYPY
ncbi:MAG: hypothetical protein HY548_05035 [Elusimicrobia bacterium]|nr:hypothetical protein [Elusimicrobiota bacterium]